METGLQDQLARQRFMTELERNFCVSAGAGVGKTTAIVERVAQLALLRPEALSRLVVVTYTKAAADELRVRSRARVLEQLGESAHRRQNLLAELRRAFFGTIHSFCLRIVREQGRHLGLPQKIDLLEETDAGELWERFCESPPLDALPLDPELMRGVLRFLSFQELLAVAKKMEPEQAETILAAPFSAPMPKPDFQQALADNGGRAREQTAKNQHELRAWLRELDSDAPFLPLLHFDRGSGSFKESYASELAPLARWLGGAAARLAAQIARGFRDFRRDARRMTYADQIAWARRLVAEPSVLDRLRGREFIVILDEAQDTDAAMFSILTEITRPRGAALGEWPRDKAAPGPEPGRFCFVGDEQQAIYASRANLGTYREYLDAFAARSGGEPLEFSVTMRCPRRVIDAVNAIFFADHRLRQTHLDFRALVAKPTARTGEAWRLEINPLPGEKQIDRLFQSECEQVAQFLLASRPAGLGVTGWNEIAILCPRHKWLACAVATFTRAGIPCRLQAEKNQRLELAQCSWPAALFYVLANPWDRFELIGVLREIFAVSDVDLAEAHMVSAPLTLWSRTGLSPRLESALKLLRGLRDEIPRDGAGTLSRFVERVLAETKLEARLEAIGESAADLEAFRREALQAECDGVSWRDWAGSLCDRLRQNAASATEPRDEMPILTCQKSKGLEWPVVIPLGLGRTIGERSRSFPRVEAEGKTFAVHLCAATVDQTLELEREQKRDEEMQRVFYVTLTRAKSLLIIPDSTKLYPRQKSSFLDLGKWAELDCAEIFQTPSLLAPPLTTPLRVEPRSHERIDKKTAAEAVRRSQEIPHRILPSELGHDTTIDLPEGEPMSQVGGADYGTWWHATMQHFPWLGTPVAQREHLQRRLAATSDSYRSRAVQELEASALFRDELRGVGRHFLSEIPFSHPRSESEWMEGVLDLLVVTEADELWIVDWKTDRRFLHETAAAFGQRLRDAYLPQLEAYGEVLREGRGRVVARLIIYSTELGSAVC